MAAPRRHSPQPDRRGPGRPRPGDVRACPSCSTGSVEFNERYRLGGAPVPAWVCDTAACGYREQVRSTPSADDVLRAAREVITAARRAAMKARTQHARARQRIVRNQGRIARDE